MFPEYLFSFNQSLQNFQRKFPKGNWTDDFKNSLINDYSFFSTRVEDPKLQYGETIKFLNDESIRAVNLKSLQAISDHQSILKKLIENINSFELTEEKIKEIHSCLMNTPQAWEIGFEPHLVANYRNFPVVGYREPLYKNKNYCSHFNLEVSMASFIEIFNSTLTDVDNTTEEKHLLTRLAFFHNKFLNEVHPFADGNGRVCRIIMGVVMMKNNCPPIFPQIKNQQEQIEYIETIIECENAKSDIPLVKFLASGMTNYMNFQIMNYS